MTWEYLTSDDLVWVNWRVEPRAHVMRPDALHAAVGRPSSGFGDLELFPTLEAKTAALLHAIVSTHPFSDGNKRTSVIAAMLFYALNGGKTTVSPIDLGMIALGVARDGQDVTWVTSRLLAYAE